MELLKKIGAVIFALALFVGVAVAVRPVVKATGLHADLQAAMYVSTDNGQTWRTGEPSICVEPGAHLQVLYKIWNAGDLKVKSVSGYSGSTNGQYISENDVIDADEDGDGHSYIFGNGADFDITNLEPNGSEDRGYQGIITTANLTDDIPCDTPIRGEVVLTRFDADTSTSDGRQVGNIIGRAFAATNVMDTVSTFTVNVNRNICPKVCGSSTATSTTTTLPQTGSSIIDLINSLF